MSPRFGWTTPRWRRRRLVAQFMEIPIRSWRYVGALALTRVQGDQRFVGPLRPGRRYARDALHCVCGQRWNGELRKRLARVTACLARHPRLALERRGLLLPLPHRLGDGAAGE